MFMQEGGEQSGQSKGSKNGIRPAGTNRAHTGEESIHVRLSRGTDRGLDSKYRNLILVD